MMRNENEKYYYSAFNSQPENLANFDEQNPLRSCSFIERAQCFHSAHKSAIEH